MNDVWTRTIERGLPETGVDWIEGGNGGKFWDNCNKINKKIGKKTLTLIRIKSANQTK